MNINLIFEQGESYEVELLGSDVLDNVVAIGMSELTSIDMSSIDGGEEKTMSMADYMDKFKRSNI